MKKYKIKSFCKINLTLRVLKKLSNGYHKIQSLITFCQIHDIIYVSKINGFKDKIKFYGKFKSNISKKSNTIKKLLFLLRKKKYLNSQAFKIDIKKNIPHGSGLGGGSSNAANLLNFLNTKMNLKLSNNSKVKIASKIGSDTPISLEKKNTLLTEKNNKILRINRKFGLNILIVYPNIICSTKKIYSNYKKISYKKVKNGHKILLKKNLIDFLKAETNDLEETVIKFYPEVRKIINIIQSQNGCHFSRITGSGSACVGIFSSIKHAILSQKVIRSKFPKYWSVVSKTI